MRLDLVVLSSLLLLQLVDERLKNSRRVDGTTIVLIKQVAEEDGSGREGEDREEQARNDVGVSDDGEGGNGGLLDERVAAVSDEVGEDRAGSADEALAEDAEHGVNHRKRREVAHVANGEGEGVPGGRAEALVVHAAGDEGVLGDVLDALVEAPEVAADDTDDRLLDGVLIIDALRLLDHVFKNGAK